MTLSAGSRLGPYEIVAPLGAGGMGEVYRARDTRLERTVAIKVLSSHLSASPEVRQRFEREAKTISQLSHPHICALHDVGREGDVEYLVMEYLEGETLADRLLKGPLPLEQTLRYGIQIADALDKAHRQGVVHRDLKPGNVMLTKTGVKLLDFGLAKVLSPARSTLDLTSFPTQAAPVTREGTLLGTVQYLAPEQLEGKDADARTDIFAFGCVLYEMATGKKAFSGSTQASLISSILRDEPQPISQVQPMSPPALDHVVKKSLAKDPDDRWQNAADLGGELKWIAESGSQSGATAIRAVRRRSQSWIPWAVAAIATLAAAGIAFTSRRPREAVTEPMLLTILPPQRTLLTDSFEISPDGRKLVFGGLAGGKLMLRVRELDSDEVRALPGTETAESPFWSPDGRFLVFFSRAKLRRIELSTGSIEVLCDAELGRGGPWGSQGDILFTPKSIGTIYRISASGGQPGPATTLEPGEVLHRWPYMLPDGRRFLLFVKTDKAESTGIYLASLDKPGHKLLVKNGATGLFLAPDILLFVRGEALLAQHLDLDRGELRGDPEAVTRPVMRADVAFYRDLFSVSRQGIVVFRPGSASRRLVWMDRRGTMLKAVGPTGAIMNVSLSSDNRTAGFTLRQVETGIASVWTLDLARDVATPFAETGWMPIFTPDGNSILYRSEGASFELRRRSLKDGREATIVADSFATPYDVSADGRYVLYNRTKANADIGVASLIGDAKPQLLLTTEYEERNPSFSRDGHWFTYSSSEPGQHEVFVRRFPMTDEKWAISNGGGLQPLWSHDGKEIFYVTLDGRLMAAPVSAGATFSLGTPQPLFQTSLRLNNPSRQYAASADGQRFLMVVPAQDVDSENFRVMLNWRRSGRR
ncbi:MAG TPA: protein kinase [Thermoanaerobaculia bacterium]|nr:protein kinase [Thermoanaerobaculia bacterium]